MEGTYMNKISTPDRNMREPLIMKPYGIYEDKVRLEVGCKYLSG